MTLDLHRVLATGERVEIAADGLGSTWDVEELTVADVIMSMAGIGYGGHFDECSDEEHDAHSIMAGGDDERTAAIHAARNEYTNLLRDAMNAVAWPPPSYSEEI